MKKFIALLCSVAKADHICDKDMLLLELSQDLKDNGVLDCLRVSTVPAGTRETDIELNMRLGAQWDSDCSFEADNENLKAVMNHYGIPRFVDTYGLETDDDDPNQADFCELIRAAFKNDKFGRPG